ncbi:substrate-binding periplasmic protein [Hahella ganghwensis]|uniref:substrate-binding periplasmic protein n=1 Tax=Hahella ganghwensis TaxID=286420 RepID=UPI00035CDD64|nr:transporter substrate-binding domain-containing protein [Hahella ganghwensis]
MRKFHQVLLLILLFLSGFAGAGDIRVAVGLALPPYVLTDSNSGMELDVVREALKLKGHSLTPVYLPFIRFGQHLAEGKVDAAMTINEGSQIPDIVYSDTHITYQNVAVALESSGLQIKSVQDLAKFRVIAFQNATKYLGAEFAAMAEANSKYSEKAQQEQQITLLYSGRTDVVVMDINIFKYFKKLEKKVSTDAPVTIFEIFQPTAYKVGFRNREYRDDFNAGLKTIKDSGRYQEILNSYLK